MSTEKLLLPVKGMHCASCAMLIEKTLSETPGITKAEVNVVSEKIALEFDSSTLPLDTIAQDIHNLGYELVVPKTEDYTSHIAEYDHSEQKEHNHSMQDKDPSVMQNTSFPTETRLALSLAAITLFVMG